jgi:CPA2 family monovalent cation:H+ antiporter-2
MSIKFCIIFVLCKIWKQTTAVSVENAVLLSQAGEFGLLVVGSALTVGLMEQSVGQFMLITVGITMLLAPILAPFARRLGQQIERKSHNNQPYHANHADNKSQHIVIFGYGRVGQEIGNILCQEGYEILGFDKNIERVNKARLKSTPVYLGNASQKSTLNSANLEDALGVVVTLDDVGVTKNIIKEIRNICASVPIVIRAHNTEDERTFNDFDNVDAVAENMLISAKLSEKILNKCGFYDKIEKLNH